MFICERYCGTWPWKLQWKGKRWKDRKKDNLACVIPANMLPIPVILLYTIMDLGVTYRVQPPASVGSLFSFQQLKKQNWAVSVRLETCVGRLRWHLRWQGKRWAGLRWGSVVPGPYLRIHSYTTAPILRLFLVWTSSHGTSSSCTPTVNIHLCNLKVRMDATFIRPLDFHTQASFWVLLALLSG